MIKLQKSFRISLNKYSAKPNDKIKSRIRIRISILKGMRTNMIQMMKAIIMMHNKSSNMKNNN